MIHAHTQLTREQESDWIEAVVLYLYMNGTGEPGSRELLPIHSFLEQRHGIGMVWYTLQACLPVYTRLAHSLVVVSSTALPLLHGLKDQILRLLARLAITHDRDGFTHIARLVLRDLDRTACLLADLVHFAPALADDVTV
jgi:hypothetical protein